jgi:hypothetical protein
VSVATAEPQASERLRTAAPPPWPLSTRVAFRFVFVWLLLLIEPFPLALVPGLRWGATLLQALLDYPITWTTQLAAWLVHYGGPLDVPPNGSGDRSVDWIHKLGSILLALLVTAVWSALDRRPRRYDRLYTALRVLAIRRCASSRAIGSPSS